MRDITPAKTWTIRDVLAWTTQAFSEAELPSARLDAELLLGHVLALQRIQLYLEIDKPLTSSELARFRELVRRRLKREPVAYLLGRREFWSLDLEVTDAVLIPRPETEGLVEMALQRMANRSGVVVDVGTGSGAIAIALAVTRPDLHVVAIDVEPKALQIARKNAAQHAAKVHFLEGDLLAPWRSGVHPPIDLIVANLPYIPTARCDTLASDVRDFEPRRALDGGPDGLTFIRSLIVSARELLPPGAGILLEIDPEIAAATRQTLEANAFRQCCLHRDLAGLDRIVSATKAAAI